MAIVLALALVLPRDRLATLLAANREAWAAEEMASRVRGLRQTAEPNAYHDWFFGR